MIYFEEKSQRQMDDLPGTPITSQALWTDGLAMCHVTLTGDDWTIERNDFFGKYIVKGKFVGNSPNHLEETIYLEGTLIFAGTIFGGKKKTWLPRNLPNKTDPLNVSNHY